MKRVLVTGATGGIGQEIASLLAELEIDLTLVGRNEESLQPLKEKFAKKSRIEYLICDHSKPDDQRGLESYIREGSFDLVINNAGFGLYGEVVDLSLERQREMIEVNIQALVGSSHAAASKMKSEGLSGVIVNVASLAAFLPMPLMAVYGATKAFVTSFSEAMDYEMKERGIRVLAFCPGMVATPFAERAARKALPCKVGHQMSSVQAARELLWQIIHKKGLHLCDTRSALRLRVARLLPRSLQMYVVYRNIKKRI